MNALAVLVHHGIHISQTAFPLWIFHVAQTQSGFDLFGNLDRRCGLPGGSDFISDPFPGPVKAVAYLDIFAVVFGKNLYENVTPREVWDFLIGEVHGVARWIRAEIVLNIGDQRPLFRLYEVLNRAMLDFAG
jgi:hypothetical protein